VLVRVNEERFMILLPRTHFTGSWLWRPASYARSKGTASNGRTRKSVCKRVSSILFSEQGRRQRRRSCSQAESALKKAQDAGGSQICLFQHTAYFYRPDMGR